MWLLSMIHINYLVGKWTRFMKKKGGLKFGREMETIRKNQIGILELENTRSERGSLETEWRSKSQREKRRRKKTRKVLS